MADYTLIIRGVRGSEHYWQKGALGRGINVRILTFEGHVPQRINRYICTVPLSDKSLDEADVHVRKASERLKLKFPCNNEYQTNLVKLMYCVIKDVEAVVAIAKVKDNAVQGRTGWATTMANDLGKDVYVYDVKSLRWYKYENEMLRPCEIPRLPKTFAGVGSRSLCEEGKRAIDRVFKSMDRA